LDIPIWAEYNSRICDVSRFGTDNLHRRHLLSHHKHTTTFDGNNTEPRTATVVPA
ncbi:hypothetical protein LINPERPRIM_LOCUS36843, partial [Linum perenne]